MTAIGRKLTSSLKVTAISSVLILALSLVAQPAYAQGQVHIVQAGETLSSIAARYGTTPQAIAAANNLANANYIYAGQRLTIPSGGGAAASGGTHTVGRGETLSSIAARYGTTVAALVRANGLASANMIYVGQRLTIAGGGAAGSAGSSQSGSVYTVRSGDTLAAIAARYGTTAWAIASANGLSNANYIYPGQQLKIPAGGSSSSSLLRRRLPPPEGRASSSICRRSGCTSTRTGNWCGIGSSPPAGPGQETVVGHFKVLNKIPNAYAYTWSLRMPYWLGIYWAGSLQNGIHALPIGPGGQTMWGGYLGQRVSYGCVILSTQNAATLYNWAPVGTPVDIVW